MKQFMDKDFVLENETAKHLYFDYASKMPLADYHCHLNPKEIYEDRKMYRNPKIGKIFEIFPLYAFADALFVVGVDKRHTASLKPCPRETSAVYSFGFGHYLIKLF